MKKLLFVGHTFHTRSRSSAFFLDRLHDVFDVETLFVNPETLKMADLPDGDFELVVLWQIDFLAPVFIAMGYRTVVIPMYDASAGLPDLHFKLMREALFINFSVNLHLRTIRLGCRSLYARYFPDPSAFDVVSDFGTLRGFLWQRRPDEIDVDLVDRLMGDSLSTLHVHNAPDYGEAPQIGNAQVGFGHCTITQSTWFESQADYLKVLESCNVYFAPRRAEGIGLGYLEAMARGMIVVAGDLPTHNEYISNWYNGILINPDDTSSFNIISPARIGKNARTTIQLGRSNWLLQLRTLLENLSEFAQPRGAAVPSLVKFARSVVGAYLSSVPEYDRYLTASEKETEYYVLTHLGAVRDLVMPPPEPAEGEGAPRIPGTLAGAIHLTFGQGNATPYLERGWSTPEGSHTWIDGPRGTLRLPLNPALAGHPATLSIDAFTVDPIKDKQKVEILVDDKPAAAFGMSYTYEDGGILNVNTSVPLPDMDSVIIEFRTAQTWQEPNNGRELSLALRALSITRG